MLVESVTGCSIGGRFCALGDRYFAGQTSDHDPLEPKALADQLADIVARECRGLGVAVPAVSVEPGRAIAGPSTFTLYRVGAIKDVALDHGLIRRYVAVDGGMSDNIRTAMKVSTFQRWTSRCPSPEAARVASSAR